MVKNNIVLKTKEEFEDLKTMLIEDGQVNGQEVFITEDEPPDFPCLIKIIKMDDLDIEVNLDETDNDNSFSYSEEDEEEESIFGESFGIFYDFWFLTKKELKNLLES